MLACPAYFNKPAKFMTFTKTVNHSKDRKKRVPLLPQILAKVPAISRIPFGIQALTGGWNFGDQNGVSLVND